MKKILLFIALFALSFYCYSQKNKIDSLSLALENHSTEDTVRVQLLNALCFIYRNSDLKKALEYGQKGLFLAKKLDFQSGIAEANNFIGVIYRNLGDNYESLKYYMEALNVAESYNLRSQKAYAYNNLGEAYKFQSQYEKAIDYNNKAMALFEQLGDKRGLAYAHIRLSEIYQKQEKFEEALGHAFESLKIRESIKEKQSSGASYAIIGMIYTDMGDFGKALDYEMKSLKIREEINDEKGRVYTLINLANIYLKQKQYAQAIQYAMDGYISGKKLSARYEIKSATELLFKAYQLQGDFEKALEFHILYKSYSDTLSNDDKSQQIGKAEAKFEFDKREKEMIFQQQQKDLENEKQLTQQQYIIYFVVLGFISLAVVITVVLANRRKIQQTNAKLNHANMAVSIQNRELSRQQEELMAQRDILEEANRQLTEQGLQIENSFGAAKIIQQAVLPYEDKLKRLLNEYFVLYHPKDIVSGDFYWVNQIEHRTFLIVADCTGHGVEGAFMTLIGNTLLDKIIRVWDIYDPVKILDRLHEEITIVLRQEETDNRNGMDIAILMIEETPEEAECVNMVFAGAKRSLYYIEKDSTELIEIRGDRKSIGGIQNSDKQFHDHPLCLKKGSYLYLFTDGFADQNNMKRKKIGEGKFKELISSMKEEPIQQHKELLQSFLDNHMRGTTQRDDILVLGFELS